MEDELTYDDLLDDNSLPSTPPEMKELVENAKDGLIPQKSYKRYETIYLKFLEWRKINKCESYVSENIVYTFMYELLGSGSAPTTVSSILSILQKMIYVKEGKQLNCIDSKKIIEKAKEFHVVKKSNVLTRDEVYTFLRKADDTHYLHIKLALLIALYGCCRRVEIHSITLDCIKFYEDIAVIDLPLTKTVGSKRSFVLPQTKEEILSPLYYLHKYIKLRPKTDKNKLFLRYSNGKIENSVIGINTIGSYPSIIAKFLELKDHKKYTGHCFRRSAATWLADKGVDFINIKRLGGWKDDKTAQGYIAESIENKKRTASFISDDDNKKIKYKELEINQPKIKESEDNHFSGCTFNNCNVTINK